MWRLAVVVGCPFMEMVGNVVRCWVRRCIFKVYDNNLRKRVSSEDEKGLMAIPVDGRSVLPEHWRCVRGFRTVHRYGQRLCGCHFASPL